MNQLGRTQERSISVHGSRGRLHIQHLAKTNAGKHHSLAKNV